MERKVDPLNLNGRLRLYRRVMRTKWGITDKIRKEALDRITAILNDPVCDERVVTNAINVLVKMDMVNLAAIKVALEMDTGDSSQEVNVRDAVRYAMIDVRGNDE